MLPPYTLRRKVLYRLSQLALTESIVTLISKKKPFVATDDKDEDDD